MANKYSEKINSFRKFSGLSQEAFAQKLGVSFTTVNRWENGHAVPNKLAQKNLETLWQETGFEYQDMGSEKYHLKILIVDDDPGIITMLKRILSKLDIDVIIETAEDGYEAGLKVSTFQPDIVLLDIFLPGIGGDLVCQKIKNNPTTTNIFLIIISGKLDQTLKVKLFSYGADVVLQKPVDQSQLIQLISKQKESVKPA